MMPKKLILRFATLFICIHTLSFGQRIDGIVLDKETNKPIEGVHVYFKNEIESSITNKKGVFRLNRNRTNKKSDSIYFSHVSYVNKNILIKDFLKSAKTVYMTQSINKLSEVSVRSDKKLKERVAFEKLPQLEDGLTGFGSIILGNKIYVIGGDNSKTVDGNLKTFNDNPELASVENGFLEFLRERRTQGGYSWKNYSDQIQIFDLKSEKWSMAPLKLRRRAYHSVVSSGDKIYISGGKRLSSNKRLQYLDETIEIYDQNSNNVIEDRVNPHKAVNALSLSYKDKILLIGGSIKESKNGIKTFSDEIHFQNLKTGFWYKLTTMREGKEVKGVLAGDKIYLIGGFNGRSLTTIETFDLLTDKWETVGELNKASASPGIAISDTTIFIFDNGKISTYNTRTKVLNDYLINIPLSGANMHYNNGKLYVIGGYTKNSYSKLPSSAVYSIDLKEFDMTRIYRSKKL